MGKENTNNEPPKNQEGKYVIDKNNPKHVRWLHQQQANRGAKYVNQGRKDVLDKAAERSAPLALGALAGAAVTAPVVTGLSLAGGYLGSSLGEYIAPEDYKEEGSVIGGALGGMAAPGLKLLPGFKYITNWRPFLPKGTSTTVYRQGNPDMLDDYVRSGTVRPISKETVAAKRAEDLAQSQGKRIISLLRKDFSNDLMFNREYPFYGNPSLFDTKSYKVAIVGDMNNSSALWKQRFHKGHKNIFEPYIGETKQAPLSEFDIYTRAPFGFGWFKNLK